MKIGIITDIHYGPLRKFKGQERGNGSDALERLSEVFDCFKKEGVELIVNLGDNISEENGKKDIKKLGELYDVFESCDIPTFYILGNHECTTLKKEDALLVLRMPYHYYSKQTELGELVFLDAQDYKCSGDIDIFQTEWLENELSSCNNAYVFVHQSLAEPDLSNNPWFRNGPSGGKIKNRSYIREIFDSSGKVRAVINGHLHQNRIQRINDIIYYTINSWSEFDSECKRDESYAIIEIKDKYGHFEMKYFGKNPKINTDTALIENLSCFGC